MSQNDTSLDDALAALDGAVKADKNLAAAAAVLAQARVDLVLGRDAKAVFFATVALRMRYVPDPSIDTAATDGKNVYYNPAFVAALDRAEAVGLVAHEVMHVTNAHHARMGDRDPRGWNVAADLAVNPLLLGAAMKLPAGALEPGKGPFKDMPPGLSAEEYYGLLRKSGKPTPGTGADPGGCGGVRAPGNGTPAECAAAEAAAKEMAAAAQAAVDGAGRGDLPGGIGRTVRELLAPQVDWRAVLREFVTRAARNDYCWARPNRRYIHAGLYLPGMHSEELGKVVLAVDVSGSIGKAELAAFADEMNGILEAYDCELTVLYHDVSVQRRVEWRSTDGPLVLDTPGGGGTSHVPVFEEIVRDHDDAACVVCLTDLDTSYPPAAPWMPVLWVCPGTPPNTPPFGRAVAIETRGGR